MADVEAVTKSQLAEIFGVSRGRISQYITAGLPVMPDGRVDRAAAEEWHRRRTSTQTPVVIRRSEPKTKADDADENTFLAARTRRELAAARREERKDREEAGELVRVDEVRKVFAGIGRIYAAGRENLPVQLAPRLIGLTDIADPERILIDALRETDQRIADEIESRYGKLLSLENPDGDGSGDLQ